MGGVQNKTVNKRIIVSDVKLYYRIMNVDC